MALSMTLYAPRCAGQAVSICLNQGKRVGVYMEYARCRFANPATHLVIYCHPFFLYQRKRNSDFDILALRFFRKILKAFDILCLAQPNDCRAKSGGDVFTINFADDSLDIGPVGDNL
jgi:hypothetical protein